MKKFITVFLTLLLMLSIMYIPFSATESPVAINYYAMHVAIDGHGHAEIDKADIPAGSNEIVTFTAQANEGYHFVAWKIEGTYSIAEGNEYTSTVKIHPTSDILAIAVFSDGDGIPATVDTSPIAPKTGQNSLPVFLALAILVVSAGFIMFSIKNLKTCDS